MLAAFLALTETLPMWGGVLIFENIVAQPANVSGPQVGRALSLAGATGFSTLNQASAWLTSPQSEAPSGAGGMTVPFFRFKSGARLAVACDPALASLDGGLITQQVSWDFTNQRLIPYQPLEPVNVITAMTWAAGVVSVTTTSAHGLAVGNDIQISGVVPTAYNGSVTVATVPTATTFTYALPNGGVTPGAVTTQGQVNAGGGALPVTVLDLQIGNSKTITYDAVNNFVHWNNSGSCAVIQI